MSLLQLLSSVYAVQNEMELLWSKKLYLHKQAVGWIEPIANPYAELKLLESRSVGPTL